MSKLTHDKLYDQIVERDGTDMCSRCGKNKPLNSQHEIHHYNGDDTDQRLENVCLLCHACNHLKKLWKSSLTNSSFQISAAHQKNLEAEPMFQSWLSNMIIEKNYHYPERFVIKEGAWRAGVSVETSKRYLQKVCDHPSSPYVIEVGREGVLEVWLRGHEPSRTGF